MVIVTAAVLFMVLFVILTIGLRLNFTFNYKPQGETVFDSGVDYAGEYKWLIVLDAIFFALFLVFLVT